MCENTGDSLGFEQKSGRNQLIEPRRGPGTSRDITPALLQPEADFRALHNSLVTIAQQPQPFPTVGMHCNFDETFSYRLRLVAHKSSRFPVCLRLWGPVGPLVFLKEKLVTRSQLVKVRKQIQ